MEENQLPKKKFKIGTWAVDPTKELGRGSFGFVFEGHKADNKEDVVAVKIQSIMNMNQKLGEEKWKKYINTEIKIMKAMKHDNIVLLKDFMVNKDLMYLFMEKCNPDTLQEIIKSKKLDEAQSKQIFKDIICGYQVMLDNKYIHRDFKPENILFKDNVAKIADFGLCKDLDLEAGESKKSLQVTAVGTERYKAPEMLTSQVSISKDNSEDAQKVDIWSLGMILYEMISGSLPWTQEVDPDEYIDKIQSNPVEFNGKFSEEAQDLIKNMLQFESKKRFSIKDVKAHKFYSS